MITAYAPDSTEFESNGLGVLDPTTCEVSETLNGAFELTLTHPIDEAGKWEELVDGVVIKAPCPTAAVPPVTFEAVSYADSTFSGTSYAYDMEFDENGNATSATQVGSSYPSGTSFMMCIIGLDTLSFVAATYGGATYYKRIVSYTSDTITYVWQRTVPNVGEPTATSAAEIVFIQGANPTNPDYSTSGQLTDQLFRIYRTVKANEQITVYAKHIFYDLAFEVMGAADEIFYFAVSSLATAYETAMVFTDGITYTGPFYGFSMTSDITAGAKATVYYAKAEKNLVEVIMGKDGLTEQYDAEIWRNNKTIGLFSRLGQETPIEIRQGKNLSAIKIDANTEKVFTKIWGFGKKPDGSLYHFGAGTNGAFSSDHINDYPFARPKIVFVEAADQVENPTLSDADAQALIIAAVDALFADNIDEPEITVDVNFELVEYLDEYEAVKELERVFLGDSVRVISERLGVDMQVRVNSYVFDCLSKRYKKLSMESNMRREGLLGTFERYIADSLAGG